MLNIEKYKESIKKYIKKGDDISCTCHYICNGTRECIVGDCSLCKLQVLDWLCSEYGEPEVNWSKIKQGTLIEVSDDKVNWMKQKFVAYCPLLPRSVIALNRDEDGVLEWTYGRLIKDGE